MISPLLQVEKYLPLVTVGVWWGLAVFQVARDRYRTWTEVFFLGQCLFVGAYALSDVLFFTSTNLSQASVAALASFSSLSLATLFVVLFGVVFYTRMRRTLFLTILPQLLLLPILWTRLIGTWTSLDVECATNPITGQPQDPTLVPQCPPWVGNWNSQVFAVWVLVAFIYTIVGSVALFLTYREVSRQTTKLRRRMQGLLIAAAVTLLLSIFTNTLRGFTGVATLPLLSSALSLPGVVTWVALSPLSKERLSVAVRRWKARRYEIKMAFVIYADGTLIGAEVRPGEKVIDQDLFSATLDVIQNFMRTSFPTLRGQWLRTITHGDFTLVIERGRSTYLVLVIQGEESDQLRRQMRDAVLKFEAENKSILANWRGMPSEATGVSAMLLSLLED